jgi:hypothetical protein
MNKAKLLLLFIFAFSFTSSWAQSYLGGELQVSRLTNGDFEFNLTYIQNCVSCSEGARCVAPEKIKLEYGNREFNLKLGLVDSEISKSPTKCSDCNRCTNDTCAFRFGVTTFSLRASADLDSIINQNYCTIKASAQVGLVDQDLDPISTVSSNFILLTNEFNSCATNSTPYSTYFGGQICLGRDLIASCKSNEYSEWEKDEIVYSLVAPFGVNGDVDYLATYDFDKPIYYLGFPKADLKFPRGFHFDSTDADLLFRPMKMENTIIRIKVEEYRNNTWLSTTYKDLHFEVIKCPQNNVPVISGINCTSPQPENFKTDVVVGETICFTICTTDKEKNDSIQLDWNNGIPNATFEIIDSTTRRQGARFCWTPTEADISKFPHTFVANAVDNGCPVAAFTARSFQIIVKDKPRFDVKTKIDNCGKGKIIVQDTGVIRTAQWIYSIGGRVIVRNGGLNDTVEVSGLTTGYHKYTITAIGVNGSNNIIEDSIYSNGNPPFNTGTVSYNICPSDTAFFTGSDYLTWGTSIKWSDNSNVPDSFFSLTSDKTIMVYGNNGNCADTLAIDVNVLTFDEKIEAKYRSGDAPLLVGYEITSPHDADSVFIDFGDGKIKILSTLQFPYVHEYAEKGTFDVTYQLSYQGQTCGTSAVVLNDYINVFPTGIENQPAVDFDIFPNPSNGIFVINSDLKIHEIRAFAVTGKQIEIHIQSQNQFKLISGSKGVYFIEAEFENGQVARQRLIIK